MQFNAFCGIFAILTGIMAFLLHGDTLQLRSSLNQSARRGLEPNKPSLTPMKSMFERLLPRQSTIPQRQDLTDPASPTNQYVPHILVWAAFNMLIAQIGRA